MIFCWMHWIIVSVIALQNYLIAPPSIQPALIGLNTDAVVKCVISSLTSMYSKRQLVLFSDELQWVMSVQQQRDMCVFGVRLWLLCRGCSSQRCFQRKHSYFSSRHVYISVVESLTFLFPSFFCFSHFRVPKVPDIPAVCQKHRCGEEEK